MASATGVTERPAEHLQPGAYAEHDGTSLDGGDQGRTDLRHGNRLRAILATPQQVEVALGGHGLTRLNAHALVLDTPRAQPLRECALVADIPVGAEQARIHIHDGHCAHMRPSLQALKLL